VVVDVPPADVVADAGLVADVDTDDEETVTGAVVAVGSGPPPVHADTITTATPPRRDPPNPSNTPHTLRTSTNRGLPIPGSADHARVSLTLASPSKRCKSSGCPAAPPTTATPVSIRGCVTAVQCRQTASGSRGAAHPGPMDDDLE
jgi:hypothetical protein